MTEGEGGGGRVRVAGGGGRRHYACEYGHTELISFLLHQVRWYVSCGDLYRRHGFDFCSQCAKLSLCDFLEVCQVVLMCGFACCLLLVARCISSMSHVRSLERPR